MMLLGAGMLGMAAHRNLPLQVQYSIAQGSVLACLSWYT
jgi:hypothetical protein